MVIEPDKGTLYINGVSLVANQTHDIEAFECNIRIGQDSYDNTRLFRGQIDEVRIWNVARTASQIRDNMCKRLTGKESGLAAYYRFDHVSGTSLADLSGNNHHGTLQNMNNSDWITSGAALGNISIHDYNGSMPADFSVTLSNSDADQLTATGEMGTYAGIQIYLVNECPDINTPPTGWNAIDTDHYWGVFPIGLSSTYNITYNYNGNSFVTNENALKLAYRENNAVESWTRSTATTDTGTKEISKTNETRAEYILAENKIDISDIPIQQITDSPITFTITDRAGGDTNITVSSSNYTIISNAAIDIAGSETNSYTHTLTADIPMPLTIAFSNTANQYGFVTLTVTAQNSNGVTCTNYFYVIVSPPGPGFALNFNGEGKGVSADIATQNTNFCMELWIKWSGNYGNYPHFVSFIACNGSTGGKGYAIYLTPDDRYLGYYCSSGFGTENIGRRPLIDEWEHVALVVNGENLYFYVNGVLELTKTGTPSELNGGLNLGNSGNPQEYYLGQIDELRIWDAARSETQIRENMCKRLTGNETNLVTYYRFDHSSGTFLADLSTNANHAALISMNDSNWVTSGAAISDASVYDYTGAVNSDFVVNLASSQGDQFTATGDGGSYTGIHLYLINESPNVTTPPTGWSAIDTDHYWGIFPIGTNPTYEITYNYTGNSFVDNENALKLAYREDNSISSWSGANTTLNTSLDTLSQSSYTRSEFVLGDSSPNISEIPDQATAASDIPFTITSIQSGDITITVTSSNYTLISNANINVAASGSNTYVESITAGSPVPLTLSLSPTANEHGLVTLTVTVIDSYGYTNSTNFTVIVSPPGAGNSLDFDGSNDYVNTGTGITNQISGSTAITIEYWYKGSFLVSPVRIQDSQYIVAGWHASAPRHIISTDGGSSGGISCGDTSSIYDGNWHHLAMTWQKNTTNGFNSYLDGVLVSSRNSADVNLPNFSNTTKTVIGCYSDNQEYIKGQLDEVRIWSYARSISQIRKNMCTKLSGSETGLIAYYRFDHCSGTIIADLSGNGHNGTLQNMDNSDWLISGAALGDTSIYDYDGSTPNNFSVTLSYSDADQFTATGDSGAYSGIHLYLINEVPNSTSPPNGWNAIDTDHYWGIFPVGTSPTYEITYNYSGNPFVTNEDALKLAYREENSINSWSRSTATINTGTNTINKSNETRAEYILAENKIEISDITTQQITDSPVTITITDKIGGDVNITVSSSNYTIISNANINIAGSGLNSYSHTMTANIPVPLTIAFSNTADQYGFVTLTVTAQNSNGVTCTNYFYVIVSPPGSGNALDFDGSNDYVNIGNAITKHFSGGTAITIEYWYKGTELESPVRIQIQNSSYIIAGWQPSNPIHIISTDGGTSGGISCGDTAVIYDGNWHHFAMTWQKNTTNGFNSYLDGVLVSSRDSANVNLPIFSDFDTVIGAYYYYNQEYIKGQLDEVRIWTYTRSISQIRENMCKKLSGSETGLIAYYRFDHNSGTTLADLSGNNNHGILHNMNSDNDWVISGAAIGDVSVYDYTGSVSNDFSVSIAHSQGDQFTATFDGGTFNGIQLYLINENPNVIEPPSGWSAIDTDHYWGIFPVGTDPTYEITYNYNGNSFVTTEEYLKFAYRENNSINSWSRSTASINTGENSIKKSNETRAEYVLAENTIEIADLPTRQLSGSPITLTITDKTGGDVYITVSSSNYTIITNEDINIAGSCSNSYTHTMTANIPVPLTIALSNTTGKYGFITLTVTAQNSNGVTCTNSFKVIVSPPGAGNALDLDGSEDYITLGENINISYSSLSIEFWLRRASTHTNDIVLIQGTSDVNCRLYVGFYSSNRFVFTFYSSDLVTNSTYTDLDWHHWACTFDYNTRERKIYRDGVEIVSEITTAYYRATGIMKLGYDVDVTVDELRIWSDVRSESEIRDNMCKKLNGNESDLVAYYRFEDNSSSYLPDLSGNGHNGTFISIDNSNWITSGAAIGDVSVYDYTGTVFSNYAVNMASSYGDQLTATGDGGTYTGIQLYLINESPNITTPPISWNAIDTDHYWGIFPVGTNPTYEIIYNYNGNPFVTNEDALKMAYREDNTISTWSRSTAATNTGTDTINKSNETKAEYILAEHMTEIPDIPVHQLSDSPITITITDRTGGDVNITVSSSNYTIISNTDINIEGSGSNSYTLTTAANVPVPLTIAFSNTAVQFGFITFTVTAQNSNGVTCTNSFKVIVSPPGAGNALEIDGNQDVSITLGADISFAYTSFSVEFWMRRGSLNTQDFVFDQGVSGVNNRLYVGFLSSNQFAFHFYADNLETSLTYTDLDWHHWACTYDSSSKVRKIYRDGVEIDSDIALADYHGGGTMKLGKQFHGAMDELRIWAGARTASEIRDNMCKKLTGNEPDLTAYYRFEDYSNTYLPDLSGNGNDGTFVDISHLDWITSGAALGDVSIYDYTGSTASDFIVNLASLQGDQFTATGESGSYTGIHLYLINESPNTTTPPSGWNAIDTDHYWGIFPVGTSPTYEITYNYNGNPFVSIDNAMKLAYREDNSASSWSRSSAANNTVAKTITKSNEIRSEYILARNFFEMSGVDSQLTSLDDIPLTITHQSGGNVNITVTSSNESLIENAKIDIAGSGTNSYTLLTTADVPVFLSITVITADNISGFVTLTVTATDPNGLTITYDYRILVSPPGTGPGGIGRTDGLSNLELWLKSDMGVNYSNTDLISWENQSGYTGRDANNVGGSPDYLLNQINGYPMISFDGVNDSLSGSTPNLNFSDSNLTIILVSAIHQIPSNNFYGIFSLGASGANDWDDPNGMCFTLHPTYTLQCNILQSYGSNKMEVYKDVGSTSSQIYTLERDNGNASITINALNPATDIYSETSSIEPDNYIISARWLSGVVDSGFKGENDYAEIIIYNGALSNVEQNIIHNYLSAKYNIAISSADKYSGDTTANGNFDIDVAGIGKDTEGTNNIANSGGLILNGTNFLVDNGDYVFAGHAENNNKLIDENLPSGIHRRMLRNWYIDRTDGGGSNNGNLSISFDYSDAGLLDAISDASAYSLLFRSDRVSDFTIVPVISTQRSGDKIIFKIADTNLLDGYYTLGTSFVFLPGAGNALTFDGINDYVEIPYHSDLNSNIFTISVWAKVDGGEGTIRSVVVSRDTSPFSGFMIYAHDNNKWYFQYGNGSVWEGNSCSLIVLHQWTHIAITNDGSQFKGYVNGKLELQGSGFVENPSRPLRIGAGATNTTPGDFFNGQIDELRVYQTVLSQEEIRAEMCKRIAGSENGLNAYYRFDHTTGTNLVDLTGSGHNGTLYNMDNSDWVTSGAALGDISIYDYTGTNASDFIVHLSSSQGDQFTATGDSGSYSGIQLYLINESPNISTPPSTWNAIDMNHYWGVFTVGTNPTFTITYNYAGNIFVENETNIGLAYRKNNAVNTWTSLNATLDTGTDTLSKNTETRNEYVLIKDPVPEFSTIQDQIESNIHYINQTAELYFSITSNDAPCSLTITMISSDPFIIPNNNISVSCDNNHYTAAIQPLTDMAGPVSITLVAENSAGITSTRTIALIISNNIPGAGRALAFDGIDDLIDLSEVPTTGSGAFTIEAWIKTNESGRRKQIINYGDLSTNNGAWLLINPSDQLEMDWSNTAGPTSTMTITDGIWHHVAGVYESGNISLYIDGKADGTASIAIPNIGTTMARIGYPLPSNGAEWIYKGQMDDIRIWNTARSIEQIQENMNKKLIGTESNLVAYYRFDHTSGDTLLDLTASENHGTLTQTMDTDISWIVSTAPIGDASLTGTNASNLTPTETVYAGIEWTDDPGADAFFSTIQVNDFPEKTSGLLANYPAVYWEIYLVRPDASVTSHFLFKYDNIGIIEDESSLQLYGRATAISEWMPITGIVFDYQGNSTDGIGHLSILNHDVLTGAKQFILSSESTDNPFFSVSQILDQTVAQNESITTINFTVQNQTGSLTISSQSSNTTIVTNENISVTGDGPGYTLSITPTPDESGQVNITLTISDGSYTITTDFDLTINGPPTITSIMNIDLPQFLEDFSTTSNADLSATTADWSISDGYLKLPEKQRRYHPFSENTVGADITDYTDPTSALITADMDGDGDIDLITGSAGHPIRLYLNNGTSSPYSGITGQNVTADLFMVSDLVAADFNLDGHLDIIAGNYGVENRLYLNNGTSNPFDGISGANVVDYTSNTESIIIADINNDGFPDLIEGNEGHQNYYYLNNGTSDPFDGAMPEPITNDTDLTQAIAAGDINNDGYIDIVVANEAGTNKLYINNGTDDPFNGVSAINITSDSHDTESIVLKDMNGDGYLDVVCGNTNQVNTLYLHNQSADPFNGVTAKNMTSDTNSTKVIAAYDMDNDGDFDLIEGNSLQINYLYLNNGTSDPFNNITRTAISTDTHDTRELAIADMNNDGTLDMMTGNNNFRTPDIA